jgi:hypothetical protein
LSTGQSVQPRECSMLASVFDEAMTVVAGDT